ncbi:bifunctional protein HldE [Cellvibrio zantedeschiae]|uniref:Bifunctional protein HldE n=1 Tax=Cellvibrio zantedeschiae TaxID=1237077 RepID=A0ABQ3B497_9GAMM|nr:bifunctional D-glycero-beta-D-manno-heptose-7-phosphate kinase/D-glycero-beta-D-manno-heptose 1-phosphate adenylyltransferase HldE [Cellvibrio zantedeschiae]GGY78672.1 bifunctional protein HldE [Cellvibrio zantedeschiae]
MRLTMPQFDSSHVLIIGDVMLDRYWHGSSNRVSPEAPVPIVNVSLEEERPGGAGNVALNIAALGGRVSLVGVVGDDPAAALLKSRLDAAGIFSDLQVSKYKPTITKLRVMSRHQQLLRMDFEEVFGVEDSDSFEDKIAPVLPHADILVLSDYAKGTLQDCQALIKRAKTAGIPVLVDPKGGDFERYQGASLLTPNIAELEAVVGRCESEQDIVRKGLQLIAKLNIDALLVTRGEMGMTLLRAHQAAIHLPARAREVYDVTGAGDTVIAVLAAVLATGQALPDAVALANLAAGIVVGKLGAATVSAPELRRAIHSEHGFERGIVSEDQLIQAIEASRANGERIVFTNGCFDIIHAGHVGYLDEARKQGDRLIVALNSDASVRRLKGQGRPINPVDRRMAVLAGLESVDWVVSFDDDTPERLLRRIKPDVLVKGGDYRADQIVGGTIVKANGGNVKVLRFFENCSTTSIVNRIRQQ